MNLYRIESQKKRPSSDLGKYWTSSGKRIAALVTIIGIGIITIIIPFLYPTINDIHSVTSNYTTIESGIERDIEDTKNYGFNQISLAIIIGIIIIILWPSIQSIKLGTTEIEVIKLSPAETKENLYMSWIPEDEISIKVVFKP